MPTLNWIGKDKVVNHHQDVPYRVLEHQYGFRSDNSKNTSPTNSGNKIIHGDNLEALKSLLPEYEGRVKCIYIDPPYNTGNENWVYNDNVNDPKIKKWLGEVVGKQGEDLSRHDKWLCMMYPRLKLLRKLLAEDGAIFISIDDNELANLKLLCNEIFGENNFIALYKWNKTSTPPSLSNKVRGKYEYILCYEKAHSSKTYNGGIIDGGDMPLLNAVNKVGQLVFPKESILFKITGNFCAGKYDNILLKNDIEVNHGQANEDVILEGHFKWTQTTLDKEIQQGTKFVIKSDKFSIRYARDGERIKKPSDVISKEECEVGTNEEANKELTTIFNGDKVFNYPKPASLIQYLINFICDKDSVILDSFAGSGTTAHAVLNLNQKDGGNRKFILVEMEDYAESTTAERVRRVMQGYGEDKNAVAGTGGAFDYYELGEPMFNEDQNLNENIGEDKIREYIYYTETRQHLTRKRSEKSKYLLDTHNATGYYFYYERDRITTLSIDTLNIITELTEQYVIYADICTVPPKMLTAKNITFKKIPRDIKRF